MTCFLLNSILICLWPIYSEKRRNQQLPLTKQKANKACSSKLYILSILFLKISWVLAISMKAGSSQLYSTVYYWPQHDLDLVIFRGPSYWLTIKCWPKYWPLWQFSEGHLVSMLVAYWSSSKDHHKFHS